MVWKSLEFISGLLDPAERQQVLGDIQERGPNARALLDLIGLVLLRQLQAWTSWRPWAMTAILTLPAMYAATATHPIAMMIHSGHLISFQTTQVRPWVALGAPIMAWATGFALGRIGKRTAASVLPLAIIFFAVISYQIALQAFRYPLPPLWSTRFQLSPTVSGEIATAIQLTDTSYRLIVAIGAMILLTAIPSALGFHRGLRHAPVRSLTAIILASIYLATRPLFILLDPVFFIAMSPISTSQVIALWPLIYLIVVSRRTPRPRPVYN